MKGLMVVFEGGEGFGGSSGNGDDGGYLGVMRRDWWE